MNPTTTFICIQVLIYFITSIKCYSHILGLINIYYCNSKLFAYFLCLIRWCYSFYSFSCFFDIFTKIADRLPTSKSDRTMIWHQFKGCFCTQTFHLAFLLVPEYLLWTFGIVTRQPPLVKGFCIISAHSPKIRHIQSRSLGNYSRPSSGCCTSIPVPGPSGKSSWITLCARFMKHATPLPFACASA